MNSSLLRFAFKGLAIAIAMAVSTPAMAGLTIYYDVSNWTTSASGTSVPSDLNLSGAPDSITMNSSDAGGGESNLDFTIVAPAAGVVSFDWLYTTNDVEGSFYDPFGILVNGVFTQLTTDDLFGSQSGNKNFFVNAGDVFGFRQNSFDSEFGPANTVISNFSGPGGVPSDVTDPDDDGTVPEPSSMVLLGLGGIGMGLAAWRRKRPAVA